MHCQFVYIAEAHASDEWPVGSHIDQPQPRSTNARVGVAARRLKELGFAWPGTLVDTADETFHKTYACWPLRWYFLDGHRIEHVALPRASLYDVREIEAWVEEKICADLRN